LVRLFYRAELKIYLDASASERAHLVIRKTRRRAELDYHVILDTVIERDRIDSTRDVAPLRAAHDAVVIDSDK